MYDFAKLRDEIIKLSYPPNYDFDVETLEPTGDLARRIECLNETAPEMMQGSKDWEFFDIGANKGFLPLHLHDKYKYLYGWEPDGRYVDFSIRLRNMHKIDNVFYDRSSWQNIGPDLVEDVVYCGGIHHHGFNDCIMSGRHESEFMKIVAGVARRYLIIDGPWHLDNPDHNTAGSLARTHKWTDEQRKYYTIEAHAKWISNDFDLVRYGPSGTGDRQIVVFKRK